MAYILDIANDCKEYSARYQCTLEESVKDWEGYDENGSYGLSAAERALVYRTLGIEEYDPYAYDY